MHHNFYFIQRLAQELQETLEGSTIKEAFSQNKDELILGFSITHKGDFFIKANLSRSFSCLSFTNDFARSKRNSVDLFLEIIGAKVLSVRWFLNERAFYIDLGEYKLVFKLFGRFSNVILFKDEISVFLFNRNFIDDHKKMFSNYHRDIDQSYDEYLRQGFNKTFPTLRGEVEAKLKEDSFFDKSTKEQYDQISQLIERFSTSKVYVGLKEDVWRLSFWKGELTGYKEFENSVEALNYFNQKYVTSEALTKGKQVVLKEHLGKLKKLKKTHAQLLVRKDKIESQVPEKELADIIMANLFAIPERSKSIKLFDFYRNQQISIPLKKDLSPQANAERYYRRAKKQHLEVTNIDKNISGIILKINDLETEIETINSFKSFKELKPYLKESKVPNDEVQLFKYYEKDSYKILVGRNSKNNDLLTLKYAKKDDLWLHAKDVSGSHVIIKHQSGKTVPHYIIEYAASIAAYYSKRKTDSLCPVSVTPKKFVRKVKGSPPGAVIVEKEKVVLVKPGLEK